VSRLFDLPSAQTKFSPVDSGLEPTFRDPAGELRLTGDCALRKIRPVAWEKTQAFLSSSLCKSLEQSCDLITSRVASPEQHSCIPPGELWLEHPRIDPISYPWEWTPAQWRAAAELTLRVESRSAAAGWTLKDATPLNIVFTGPRPVLVDALSFERRDSRSTVWLAYGQFVRTFLLPLVAAKYLHWSLQATLFNRDGYEPGEIYKALPHWHRLRPALFDVVTLAVWLERRGARQGGVRKPPTANDPRLAAHILERRIARLSKQVRYAAGRQDRSQWSDYTQTAHHYEPGDVERKVEFVRSTLERLHPAQVLDIGANTGTYSQIAAQAGGEVVALDNDAAALEKLWENAAHKKLHITALVANIARPTPAAGWRNREHLSLLDRLAGKFDMVLMLAVIHHLILREQLPLEHIGELAASLTRRWLLVEWVPPSDPMYQEWLRGRDELYGHFTEEDMKQAFLPFFTVAGRLELRNKRVLLLFERIPGHFETATGRDKLHREASPA
jgi:SAM-dependent methyltransferase